jgi:mannose-1-phosphate guanylyltransferase / mannose-6-phosphate isomerase
MKHLVVPVVLSGGSGTRLWPLSREKYPKQLLPLMGEDSLLQATLRRTLDIDGLEIARPVVVCNEEYRFVIAEQGRQMGLALRILLEPAGRNTAPALTIAALDAGRDGADPLLLVMPADHVISDIRAFHAAVLQGAAFASTGAMVTFGVTPTAPETGYGYIQLGEGCMVAGANARGIARFVEKPDEAKAQEYLADGGYLWNGGIFLVQASTWLAAMGICRPEVLLASKAAYAGGRTDGDFVRVDKQAFLACPSDSIDYAVMERLTSGSNSPAGRELPKGVVVPLSAGWSDVGSWDALWQVQPKDSNGNVAHGDVLMEDASNTMAVSQGRLVACVGTSNLIVVETADAILVADRSRTQDVKKIVARLSKDGRPEANAHRKVYRPWGWYDSVDVGTRFQVKRIVVKPGGILSLQLHHHRAEHWIVVSGTAKVTRGDETFIVAENQSTFIPLGAKHRLENPGSIPLEMVEVQSGTYLGEDDIVRFEDAYGR